MLSKDEAKELIQKRIRWFYRDLGFTAPELQELKWERFMDVMDMIVEEIFKEEKNV